MAIELKFRVEIMSSDEVTTECWRTYVVTVTPYNIIRAIQGQEAKAVSVTFYDSTINPDTVNS